MAGNDREKASDVFNKTNFAFAQKSTFEKAFPEIEDIKIEVEEDGDGVSSWNKKRYYGKNDVGEYINCSNSMCYNGGFSLGNLIRNMLYEKKTELETTEFCQGYEGSPKGRKKYGHCFNHFQVKIKIKYENGIQENG